MSQHKQEKMRQCHACGTRMWGTAADLIDHGMGCTSVKLKNLVPTNNRPIKRGINWYLILGLPIVIAIIIVIIYLLEK